MAGMLLMVSTTTLEQPLLFRLLGSSSSHCTELEEEVTVAEDTELEEEVTVAEDTALEEEVTVAEDTELEEEVTVAEDTELEEEVTIVEDTELEEEVTVAEDTELEEEVKVPSTLVTPTQWWELMAAAAEASLVSCTGKTSKLDWKYLRSTNT